MDQAQKIVGIGAAGWGRADGAECVDADRAVAAAVDHSRFLSDAIDPTRPAESRSMEIDGRAAANTLEQNFGFAVVSPGLSTVVPLRHLQVLWAVRMFVIARDSSFSYKSRSVDVRRVGCELGVSYVPKGSIR